MSEPDKLHYVRIPKGMGGRAEMTRMTYVLAGKPYVDVFWALSDAAQGVRGKNPFLQYPFVETPNGRIIYQTLAIMHHVAHGTPAWPAEPEALTDALAVAMGVYDLYQAFAAFSADDVVARQKFEQRRAPQHLRALDEIYTGRSFAAGGEPSFADCMVHEGIAWCVRRNEVCARIVESSAGLRAFMERFEAIALIRDFMSRQSAARERDDTL
jgi:glutathione S-transferase